ncbi:MAG: prolyl oligopeptidase family serine peptidase [Usitatibacter sp.]
MRSILLAALVASTAAWADDKTPIESFFKLPQYSLMVISPDGQHIGALAPVNGRQNLVMLDLDHRKAVPLTALDNKDIVSIRWLNAKRLLVSTGTLAARVDDARGGGLYAVDFDGGNERRVAEGGDELAFGGIQTTFKGTHLVRRLPNSDDVIASETLYEEHKATPGALVRIDTRSTRRTPISGTKPDSGDEESWVADNDGVARAFIAISKSKVRIWYRAGENDPWRKLDEFGALSEGQWRPLAVTEDNRALYVTSWRGRDKAAIVRYDPDKKQFGDVVAAHPQVDLSDLVESRSGTLLGVSYDADRAGTAWLDADLASVQAAVDKALPNSVNRLSWSDDYKRFVIVSYSDVSPGSFYHFDRATGKLQWLADRMPWIDPKKMSPMTPVRYKARDGLEIPAYLTIPRGSSGKNLPLVAVIHGGPWVTGDEWGFDNEVQVLASRGYAVLQPNYRGTSRYGWKHFTASFKQWGLTMQDDITDGVQWAIDQGIADPKRVCIYGGSYGGYATMMGLAKTPDLYKCGINYVGVTDLDLFLGATWSDFAYTPGLQYEMKDMFGDATKDAAQLKATSPVELASRIKAPVFMAYGASDVRVVPEHGLRMKAALEKAGKKPQWMIAEGEGHGYRDLKNQVMFYGAMEKFLDENIGH